MDRVIAFCHGLLAAQGNGMGLCRLPGNPFPGEVMATLKFPVVKIGRLVGALRYGRCGFDKDPNNGFGGGEATRLVHSRWRLCQFNEGRTGLNSQYYRYAVGRPSVQGIAQLRPAQDML